MTSFQLFRRRLTQDWLFQIRTFRSIADWTIWLYMIIPTIVISIFIYRSWWIDGAPSWMAWMPVSIFFLLGYLFSWTGAYRFYTDEADMVFLIKKDSLFYGLRKWGFFYSLLFQAMNTLLVVVALLPFLIQHFHLTWEHAFCYFLFLLAMKYLVMYLKFHLKKIQSKMKRIIVTVLTFILLSWFAQTISFLWINGDFWIVCIISMVVGFVSTYYYYPLVKKKSLFDIELAIEQEEKLKLVQAIHQMSFDIEKTKVYSRKRPWLFRNSKRIFKKRTARNGFLELFIKVFIRNSSYILTYLQICSATVAALVIVPPIWMKVIIFLGFLLMMWIWLGVTWERVVLSHPFTKKYQACDAYFSARNWAIGVLFICAILVVGLLAGSGYFLVNQISFPQV
ncbi:ABC transporter permease [Robertmurraya sp. Marseille-Q9965]